MDQILSYFVPAAQVISITGAGALSGCIGCISLIAVPALGLAPPELQTRQWKEVYNRGKAVAPDLAITCSLGFAALAYCSTRVAPLVGFDITSPVLLYMAAAVATPLIMPYTLLRMEPAVNKPLTAMAEGKLSSEAEVKSLMKRWREMNAFRGVLVLCSALLGAAATVRYYQMQ